jgi:rRNA-processing protein FCF1
MSTTNNENNSSEAESDKIVICDTNVVVMMTLFKPTKMFSHRYTFGKVVVHQMVIDELESWLQGNSLKKRKFGEHLITDAISHSESNTEDLHELTQSEMQKSIRYLSALESKLGMSEKGSDTSDTDKQMLSLARKNKSALATQELTMRSLAQKTLPGDKLKSFEDMVIELFRGGHLSKQEIKDGLDILFRYNENLLSEGKQSVLELLK